MENEKSLVKLLKTADGREVDLTEALAHRPAFSVASRTDSTPALLHARTTAAIDPYESSRAPHNSTTSPGFNTARYRTIP